ncbi:MAG TPA: UDP-N-acetylmuramoyl-L-alanyl-D-glutamate--2,6-diaminopimelate ligase, partial [Acidimicrobiales bacterium]|nr:UDP-N-acetylmuramoyl-L-alanyl-D-glutamate--2,6-diaminopimelate ligase [Acidimicrobiales bacterium]
VPVVVVPETQLRALLAEASAAIVGHPEEAVELVGVTGTNGKTTVTTLVAELARLAGWNGANVGTLTNERTTPAPPELMRTLAGLVRGFEAHRERSVVALEVSSHALDQGRVDGLRFAVAGFTNLSHDHLDYHETMEEYFAAKARLFTPEHSQRAVIWIDDPYGERLASSTSLPVTRVGRDDATGVVTSLSGTSFTWRGLPVSTPLVGGYNVDNALMALAIASALGAHDAVLAASLEGVHPVPGRLEVIAGPDATVVVDYAHTPEGLRRLLRDVRSLAPGARITTVFGCGGERDRAKRPEMGRVATELSDFTIVTSDNPRSESPDAIIDAIMSGVLEGSAVGRVVDRRAAIGEAVAQARAGDVVVVAGKGHETFQRIGDESLPFDDRVVARELLGLNRC